MPVDYQQGKIYTIRSPQTDQFYIGSTTQSLPKRLHGHKRDYARYQGGKGNYITSFKILEYGDAYIELYELYPCTCKSELLRREGQLQRENKDDCVNMVIAGRTVKEWYEENLEQLREKNKKWREDNKDKIREYQKKYRDENKDLIKERDRQFRQANAERINAYKAQRIECECGVTVRRSDIAKHRMTAKHQNYIN
jgi:hypothetical protein